MLGFIVTLILSIVFTVGFFKVAKLETPNKVAVVLMAVASVLLCTLTVYIAANL